MLERYVDGKVAMGNIFTVLPLAIARLAFQAAQMIPDDRRRSLAASGTDTKSFLLSHIWNTTHHHGEEYFRAIPSHRASIRVSYGFGRCEQRA